MFRISTLSIPVLEILPSPSQMGHGASIKARTNNRGTTVKNAMYFFWNLKIPIFLDMAKFTL
jgi:hypothetical protein